MGLATANVVNIGDKTSMEITLNPRFNWVESVSSFFDHDAPSRRPANHFGFLEERHHEGPLRRRSTNATVNAGESYLIPPGHLPEVAATAPWSRSRLNTIFLTSEIFLIFLALGPLAPANLARHAPSSTPSTLPAA